MTRPFRFGLSLPAAGDGRSVQEWARRAEDAGYHVVHVADHVFTTAPFPTLTAMALATKTLRVGTFVLNAGFYRPALLTREASTLRDLSGGRLELGLGSGFLEEDFEGAELDFPSAGQRVQWLAHLTRHVRQHLTGVPILVAGTGDQVLTLAARHADIVGFTAANEPITPSRNPLADRIAFVRKLTGAEFGRLELNVSIMAMPTGASGRPDLSVIRRFLPNLSDDELLATPAVVAGSARDIADTLRGYRETYGVTNITVQQRHAEAFAKVIAEM